MRIVITGASDDLIEVDGDISEEFQARDDNFVAVSNGTLLRVEYTRAGIWRITPVVEGLGGLDIVQAPEGDDENYSDVATVDGEIRWVSHGTAWAAPKAGL